MFRTRDFVLFFTVIIFLVMAIGVTLLKQGGTEARQNAIIPLTTDQITDFEVSIGTEPEPDLNREERLESLKQKIAETGVVTISEPEPEPLPDEVEVVVAESVLQRCADFLPLVTSTWPTTEVKVTAAEGVRQYYTEVSVPVDASSTAPTVTQNVLLALPTQFVPLGTPACIGTDVIGIAVDGSLIRNNETGLYSIFSSETLIGYALDGFPIYGTGQLPTDACGGRIALGQYRYELSSDRDTIVNCYAGTPQTLNP